jgi:hypothetical protein
MDRKDHWERVYETKATGELVPGGAHRIRPIVGLGRAQSGNLNHRHWRRGFPPRGLPGDEPGG